MKLELKIIDLLARNMERKFTINEIAKSLEEYYSFVHRTVNKLSGELKNNILNGIVLKGYLKVF